MSSNSDAAISVQNLGKCYTIYDRPQDRLKQSLWRHRQYFREFWALRDVSFDVKKAETVGVIGRNGSGKSTLLQLVAGTLSPTSGAVQIKGRIAALLELGSGFNPLFTGRENIFVNASILGLSMAQIEARFHDIAAFADVGDFMDQPVNTYSSGMVMRLAFAVQAHVDADVLIIDEALAVGDAFFVQKCMRYLRTFRERGTILFVSHDTAAVTGLCDRAIWLEAGEMKREGSAKDVCEAYLGSIYESRQGPHKKLDETESQESVTHFETDRGHRDKGQRLESVEAEPHRSDIEVFRFDEKAASFGVMGARIVDVQLQDPLGETLAWVVGGERVVLTVCAVAFQAIHSPIIGFFLKDRLGQTLFGDNTYLTYVHDSLRVAPGEVIEARFSFTMPALPVGDYSICVALAEGTQAEHVQHQWIHDALVFKSHSSSVSTGLVGIPMGDISLDVRRCVALQMEE